MPENSPTFQRWVPPFEVGPSPEGTAETTARIFESAILYSAICTPHAALSQRDCILQPSNALPFWIVASGIRHQFRNLKAYKILARAKLSA